MKYKNSKTFVRYLYNNFHIYIYIDKLTWRDAASVRIKLKVSATQRQHRERAARARWLVISKVRFLYVLPTYIYIYESYYRDI